MTLKNINWQQLKISHDQYRELLQGIDIDRRKLIEEFPNLLLKRKKARLEHKVALENAKQLVDNISTISKDIQGLRESWLKTGGTKENFYLHIEANKKLATFAEYKALRKEVRFEEPKRTERIFRQSDLTCKNHLQDIKKARYKYRSIQRALDTNSTLQVVTQYEEDVAHTYDAYLEIQRYQLSIKKQVVHKANKIAFVKKQNVWFKVDRHGEPANPCSTYEIRDIEKKINKYHR